MRKIDRKYLIIFSVITSLLVLFMFFMFPFQAEQYASLGYIGVILANIMSAAALYSPIPAFLASFKAAAFLNPFLIIIFSAAAVTIGESTKYLFGMGVDDYMQKYAAHRKLKSWFMKAPFIFLVIWVSLPNPIQSLGEAFAGSVNYPFRKYLLATFIGNLIWFTFVVLAGQYFWH